MDYPVAVFEKAQRLEQLLLRVAAGEPLDEANQALDFALDQEQLARWQAKYEAGGQKWQALIDGRHGHARKATSEIREWLYARKEADDSLRAPDLVEGVAKKFGVLLSAGHINYLLRKRALTAPPGRPYKKPSAAEESADWVETPGELVDNAGLFFPGGGESRSGGR